MQFEGPHGIPIEITADTEIPDWLPPEIRELMEGLKERAVHGDMHNEERRMALKRILLHEFSEEQLHLLWSIFEGIRDAANPAAEAAWWHATLQTIQMCKEEFLDSPINNLLRAAE